MKVHIVLLVVLAAVLGPAVSGAALPPTLVPAGVKIAGVDVGGKRPYLARRAVRKRFQKPLRFTFEGRVWKASPLLLASSAAVADSVARALTAKPGTRLALPVAIQERWVKAYVDYLDRHFSRQPVSAKFVGLRGLRPFITPARYGVRVRKRVMIDRIVRNLQLNRRVPIELALRPVAPAKLRTDFGPSIVIRRFSNRLYLYKGMKFWRSFGVATGSPSYPTPTGSFHVVTMQRWPTWTPPNSPWARGLKPIPPGPNNPLGTRWMGLDVYGVGIHGTPNAASIGYSQSHGCIRMRIPEAEWLFDHIQLGTRVFVVDA